MKILNDKLLSLPDMRELTARIRAGRSPLLLSGLLPIHKSMVLAALRQELRRPVVVLTADERSAEALKDTAALAGEDIVFLPTKEQILFPSDSISRSAEQDRMRIFSGMEETAFVFMTAEAAGQRTLPPEIFAGAKISLKVGDIIEPMELVRRLTAAGYTAADLIDATSGGQFSLRGSILDIWPVNSPEPVRLDFFDDEIDSIATFSVDNQRRREKISKVLILPAAEALPLAAEGGLSGVLERMDETRKKLARRKHLPEGLMENFMADREALSLCAGAASSIGAVDRLYPFIYPHFASAIDYIPENALVILDDPAHFFDTVKHLDWRRNEDALGYLEKGYISEDQKHWALSQTELTALLGGKKLLMLDTFTTGSYTLAPRDIYTLACKDLGKIAGGLDNAMEEAELFLRGGYGVIYAAGNTHRASLAEEAFRERGLTAALYHGEELQLCAGQISVSDLSLSSGLEFPELKLAILSEGQKLRTGRKFSRQKRNREGEEVIRNYQDLHPGDLIVHDSYGIGRFDGIEQMEHEDIINDYLRISYQDGVTLYIPVTQLELVSKYVGGGAEGVKLSRIGTGEWYKSKMKARQAARDMADKLIKLYAEREKLAGFAFPPDNEWQKEFEEDFEYDETEDQLRTAEEIKRDMEKPRPMDRLLCGDVGFGKTEVAFRAVMKCVMGGKQAAILAPTTVLTRQHYETALRRFRAFPVRIGLMNRFTSPTQLRRIKKEIADGTLDLVIGTHILFGKTVQFKNLGLLVVDEEQRFGVSHKEKLKTLSQGVDVLTLTATPIPRTLNMSLSGIRDLSILEEAPQNRQPVQTYVLEYDKGILGDAIAKELARGGQVYYLYNRIESIHRVANLLQEQFPEASIAVAHGRMEPEELEATMEAFTEGEIQILVCTTIIETGVDIPNVNTLIVENADRMGLAQLHQLRGRVGRSSRRAYTYLTYPKGKVLSEDGTKRLSAIREFAEFGAGFRISMRDLEIRGAGNLLGAEQSGHMISVGYEMYMRLLNEAVVEAKGEKSEAQKECRIELTIPARIPSEYISNAPERLDIYRRIAYIRTKEDAEDMHDELVDRYGNYGEEVTNLIRVARVKNRAAQQDINEINDKNGDIRFYLATKDYMRITSLCVLPSLRGRVQLHVTQSPPYFSVHPRSKEDILSIVEAVVTGLERSRPEV